METKAKQLQAAQHWQKACLGARAHTILLTLENRQLKQEHQKLGDLLAGTADVLKFPKQPTCAPPRHVLVDKSKDGTGKGKSSQKANGKGKSKGKVLKDKKPKMSLAIPIGAKVRSEE